MSKIKNIIIVLFTCIIFVACSNNEYQNIIPKSAKAVVSVNIKQLFQDFEIPETIIDKLHNILEFVITGSDSDWVIELIKGNEESGIDFDKPFYIYKISEDTYGASFKVEDIDVLDELFNMLHRHNISKKSVEKDKYKWTTLLDDISVAYNDDVLSLMYSNNFSETKKIQKSYLEVEEDKSFVATDKFKKLDEKEGPLKFIFNSDAFVNYTEDNYTNTLEQIKAFLPEKVRPVDVCVVGDFVFNKEKVNLNCELFSINKNTQKILEKEDDKFKKIKGDYIGAPNDFACWLCLGINGEDLVNKLKQFDCIHEYMIKLGLALDIENILRAIKGDLAVLLPSIPENLKHPNIVMTAKVKNTDFLKNVGLWQNQMVDYKMSMDEISKHNYLLHGDSIELNWGVDDDNLYFATGNSFFKSAFAEKSDNLNEVINDINNSVLYAYVNTEAILGKFNENDHFSKKIDFVKFIIIKASDYRNYTVSLVLKDKDKDFWQIIFELI